MFREFRLACRIYSILESTVEQFLKLPHAQELYG